MNTEALVVFVVVSAMIRAPKRYGYRYECGRCGVNSRCLKPLAFYRLRKKSLSGALYQGTTFSRAVSAPLTSLSSRAERPRFFPTRIFCGLGGRAVEGPAFHCRGSELPLALCRP